MEPPEQAEEKLERETGFEPATSTLARSHSTAELLPLDPLIIAKREKPGQTRIALAPFGRWSVRRPLRVFFRRNDLTVAHVQDAVAVGGGLRIVGDHQHGLP